MTNPWLQMSGLFIEGIHREYIPERTAFGVLPRYSCAKNRQALYGQQGGDCAGCRDHFETRHLEVDLIIARQKGGMDRIDNLQLLCGNCSGNCNRIKGNRGMDYLKSKRHIRRVLRGRP